MRRSRLSTIPLVISVFVSIISAASISPFQFISQIPSNYSASNVILNADDHHFGMKIRYGVGNLDMFSVLMNTVEGMADLAHLPSEHRVRGFYLPNLAQYTDINIYVQPMNGATDIDVRVILDGLYYATNNMIKRKIFQTSDFNLFWDNVLVAQITFSSRRQPTALEGNTHMTQNLTFNSNITTTNETLTEKLSHLFQYIPSPMGRRLSFQEVFVTITATIRSLAESPESDVVKAFTTGASDTNARFQMVSDETQRTTPPFLQYGNLIDTVRQIPAFMIENKKFAELMIIIGYDGETIGKALLEKEPLPS